MPETLKNVLLVMASRGILKPDWKVWLAAFDIALLLVQCMAGSDLWPCNWSRSKITCPNFSFCHPSAPVLVACPQAVAFLLLFATNTSIQFFQGVSLASRMLVGVQSGI